jgi:hypothetical protein
MSLTVLYARCAGLDVHKLTVVACVLLTSATGNVSREIRGSGSRWTSSNVKALNWLVKRMHVAANKSHYSRCLMVQTADTLHFCAQ